MNQNNMKVMTNIILSIIFWPGGFLFGPTWFRPAYFGDYWVVLSMHRSVEKSFKRRNRLTPLELRELSDEAFFLKEMILDVIERLKANKPYFIWSWAERRLAKMRRRIRYVLDVVRVMLNEQRPTKKWSEWITHILLSLSSGVIVAAIHSKMGVDKFLDLIARILLNLF